MHRRSGKIDLTRLGLPERERTVYDLTGPWAVLRVYNKEKCQPQTHTHTHTRSFCLSFSFDTNILKEGKKKTTPVRRRDRQISWSGTEMMGRFVVNWELKPPYDRLPALKSAPSISRSSSFKRRTRSLLQSPNLLGRRRGAYQRPDSSRFVNRVATFVSLVTVEMSDVKTSMRPRRIWAGRKRGTQKRVLPNLSKQSDSYRIEIGKLSSPLWPSLHSVSGWNLGSV